MSLVVKRSIAIRGHRTSISLEEPFFAELTQIARRNGQSFAALVAEVDAGRPRGANLSSALRVFVLDAFKARLPAADPSGSSPRAIARSAD